MNQMPTKKTKPVSKSEAKRKAELEKLNPNKHPQLDRRSPSKVWNGHYRGIGFRIVNWEMPGVQEAKKLLKQKMGKDYRSVLPDECWNHYIYLVIDKIPRKHKPRSFWLKAKPFKAIRPSLRSWLKEKFTELSDMEKTWKKLRESHNQLFGGGKHLHYEYSDHPIIPEIDGHYDVTWYEKQISHRDEKVIEIGWDYQHAWDTDHTYDLDFVLSEVKKTIDSVYKLMPEYGGRDDNA